MSKNCNPFCSKLLHFAYRCQCKCKAKCSNYYILQRYYILGCDKAVLHKVETLHHNDVWRGIVHPSFNLALYPYDQRDNLARMNIILMLVFFCQTYQHSWWGIVFRNVRRVHRIILCLNYMMFPLVLYLPLFWGNVFAVVEGWLLLDIGLFVWFYIGIFLNEKGF